MTIHIKDRSQPVRELTVEQINFELKNCTISRDAIAWCPGMAEWASVFQIEGVSSVLPPPLPRATFQDKTVVTPDLGKTSQKSKKKKTWKAILSFILVIFGLLTMQVGIGFVFLLGGAILWFVASSDLKRHGDTHGGAGWLKAAKYLVLLVGLIFVVLVVSVIIGIVGSHYNDITKQAKAIHDARVSNDTTKSIPSSLQTVHGEIANYTFVVPSNWTVHHTAANFDAVATGEGYIVGVAAQKEIFSSLKDVYEEMRLRIESTGGKIISDPVLDDKDGRKWLRFVYSGQQDPKDSTSVMWLYTGSEGTIRVIMNAKNSIFDEAKQRMNVIMNTFHLAKNNATGNIN